LIPVRNALKAGKRGTGSVKAQQAREAKREVKARHTTEMGDEKSQYVCKLKSIEQAFDVGESVLDPVLQRVKQKPIKELSHVDFKIQLKELEIDITERDFFCALERHGRDMAIMRNSFLDSKVSGQIMNSIVDRARLNAKWSIWLERRFEKNKVLSLIKHELEQKQNYKSTLPITDFEVRMISWHISLPQGRSSSGCARRSWA